MGTSSNYNKRSLHRRGKQLLKSKVGLLKRRKTSMFHLKSKSKLFAPTIVLPTSLQQSRLIQNNSVQLVHTSKKLTSPSWSTPSSPPTPSDRSTSTTKSFASFSSAKKKLKKVSLKKMLGMKKKMKSPTMEDQVNSPWVPKTVEDDDDNKTPPETILILERNDSFETADITKPNTPLSHGSSIDNAIDDNNIQEETQEGLPITPSNESSAGASSNDGNFIFADSDDENDPQDDDETLNSTDKDMIDCSEEIIQAKVEVELNLLDEKLKTQKAERRAIAKEQVESAFAEESIKSQNVEAPMKMKRSRFLSLTTVLLPIVFAMHFLFSEHFGTTYCHDSTMELAQAFFGKSSSMEGITVVLSETTSRLGSTIGKRFARLGATVASLQDDIDCNDLDSVATSVDSLMEKHGKIDFLVQTGNLCLDQGVESLISLQSTVQGHDALVGGNYLSSFLMTQKILPSLEQSQYGTLVQFTSKTSALVAESHLLPELESLPPSTIFPRSSSWLEAEKPLDVLTRLLYLPLRFPCVKMFETAQHRVLSRAYPNVRTLEISSGWIGIGEVAANDFFHRVFLREEEEEASSTGSPAKVLSSDTEDLQEHLYEWSQNAVWKWVAPPITLPPVTEMILGSSPTRQTLARSEQKSPSASVAKYFPANTATVITSGALALLAMKTKSFSWNYGASMWPSE